MNTLYATIERRRYPGGVEWCIVVRQLWTGADHLVIGGMDTQGNAEQWEAYIGDRLFHYVVTRYVGQILRYDIRNFAAWQ